MNCYHLSWTNNIFNLRLDRDVFLDYDEGVAHYWMKFLIFLFTSGGNILDTYLVKSRVLDWPSP